MAADKSQKRKEVIEEARNKGGKVHFASLVDLCHLKNSELEPQYQKYKGRVVFRCDIVEDDSGSYAVFTEQGSSASQMTGMRRTSSRLSVSLHPGQKGRCNNVIKKIQSQNANGVNHGPVWKIQSFLLSGICTVIL